MVKGTMDFIGLNYYASAFIYGDRLEPGFCAPVGGSEWLGNYNRAGKVIGPTAASPWLTIYPRGIYNIISYADRRYSPAFGPPGGPDSPRAPIVVLENGVDVPGEDKMTLKQAVNDTFRINYFEEHLNYVCRAASEGVKVTGYMAWSFLDNFEWADGYKYRFGVVHVDYKSPKLTRTAKDSARFMSQNFFKYGL